MHNKIGKDTWRTFPSFCAHNRKLTPRQTLIAIAHVLKLKGGLKMYFMAAIAIFYLFGKKSLLRS